MIVQRILTAIVAAITFGMLAGASAAQALDPFVITGEATYRERISLLPGSVLNVYVQDISLADAPAKTLVTASYVKELSAPPFPFAIYVDPNQVDQRAMHSLRIDIRSTEGDLLFTTDTVIPLFERDTTTDVGQITLVRVSSGTGSPLSGTAWRVASLKGVNTPQNAAGVVQFSDDGRISGKAGCNNFSGEYSSNKGKIMIRPLAMTRMACVPELDAFEGRMSRFLSGALWVSLQGDVLILSSEMGGQMVLVRQ